MNEVFRKASVPNLPINTDNSDISQHGPSCLCMYAHCHEDQTTSYHNLTPAGNDLWQLKSEVP